MKALRYQLMYQVIKTLKFYLIQLGNQMETFILLIWNSQTIKFTIQARGGFIK